MAHVSGLIQINFDDLTDQQRSVTLEAVHGLPGPHSGWFIIFKLLW